MEEKSRWPKSFFEHKSSKDMVTDFCDLMQWLASMGFSKDYGTYAIRPGRYGNERPDPFSLNSGLCVKPIQLVGKSDKDSRKEHLDKLLTDVLRPAEERIFSEFVDRDRLYEGLRFLRMPMDAIAFYRPFHLLPWNEWGIYFHARNLSNFLEAMSELSRCLMSLHREILKEFVLFEIFHHEFFHHIVESMITTIEMILS